MLHNHIQRFCFPRNETQFHGWSVAPSCGGCRFVFSGPEEGSGYEIFYSSTLFLICITSNIKMAFERNRRGFWEWYHEGKHLTLEELRTMDTSNNYLHLTMPDYPKPEFHLFYVKHDTNQDGLKGIFEDNGFRSPSSSILWWNVVVMPGDIQSAENRMLEETYPDRTEEQRQMQPTFLSKFATSPAFTETSRLGSFRFTFRLREVLDAYREQVDQRVTAALFLWLSATS